MLKKQKMKEKMHVQKKKQIQYVKWLTVKLYVSVNQNGLITMKEYVKNPVYFQQFKTSVIIKSL